MIDSGKKTSLLISSQLPEFVRDDPNYANFVLFLQAYYEWMEQNGNVTDRAKNILNYKDIDETSAEFLDYYYNDFLSYFPKDILADKQKVIKLARELYQSKGTPASYQFLFKVLYNSDVDFFYTKDAVLKASAGKWYVAKSLKLATEDSNFLNINNLRLFGESTKSIATIENSVFSGTKTEIFISNIERLFQSGEFVRVIDTNNQDVLFNGQPLRAKIVGQISQIKIDPSYRGLLYQPGDPIIVFNGLSSNTGHGATAEVGTTTTGSIQRIKVENGGYGYRAYPNTVLGITNAPGAIAIIGSLDPSAANTANATFIPTDYIGQKRLVQIGANNYFFANASWSNANTSFANTLSFTSFATYPISSVIVQNGGGGITVTPTISATSIYSTQDNAAVVDLSTLGILSPIKIQNGGVGYVVNDIIKFINGSGYGANAKVTSVNSSGAITSVSYIPSTGTYPLGGMGYNNGLPALSISSANTQAANAVLVVTGTLGTGATFTPLVDRVGSITTINIDDPGEDYISTPNVSFKVQDLVVSGVNNINLPASGDIIYQGATYNTASYIAVVNAITPLISFNDPSQTLYNLRVYNYNSNPSYTLPLKIDSKSISVQLNNTYPNYNKNTRADKNGVITYGDGTAKGFASFLNGLVLSSGQYLDTSGQPSSFDVLQSTVYNNYTYEITVEKEIEKYRKVLLDLLHPTGMKVLGRYALKSNSRYENYSVGGLVEQGHTLGYYTGNPGSYGTMIADKARTNLALWSNDYTNSVWNKINCSITSVANTVDPSGNLVTAQEIVPPVGAAPTELQQAFTSTAQYYTETFTVKSTGARYVQLFWGSSQSTNYANFDLTTSTVTAGTYAGATIKSAGNGWYTVTLTSLLAAAAGYMSVGIVDTATTPINSNYTEGLTYTGILVLTSQLEVGTKSTNYIPTRSSAASSYQYTNGSNNIITFGGLSGANIQNFIVANDSLTMSTENGFNVHSEVIQVYSQYLIEDMLTEASVTEDMLNEPGTEDLLSEGGYLDQVVLRDNTWLTFANVAYVSGNAGSSIINIRSVTNSYDVVNDGHYSNTQYPLMDIVFAGDSIVVANNTEKVVQSVNYVNGIIYLASNLSENVNSFISVQRTVSTPTVRIDGFIGTTYYPELITEAGDTLITEDGKALLIG